MVDVSKEDLGELAAILAPPGDMPPGAPFEAMRTAAGLESAIRAAEETDPRQRLQTSQDWLRGFLSHEFPDEPDRLDALDTLMAAAGEGVDLILDRRTEARSPLPLIRAGLEAVIETDGSRPTFFTRDGKIRFDTNPPGNLGAPLATMADRFVPAIRSTGRVDIVRRRMDYAGTAWRVAPDLVVTNRHVAQFFVGFDDDGDGGHPRLLAPRDAHVDFGHELHGPPAPRVRVTEVVFCGATPIGDGPLNHAALDLAVLRTDPMAADGMSFAIGLADDLAKSREQVVILGYPGEPDPEALGTKEETAEIMARIFRGFWGRKRVAPGYLLPATGAARTLRHDASTLGGNSGSAILSLWGAPLCVGLHYGGARTANFGHRLASVLDEPGLPGRGHPSYRTLRDVAKAEGIALIPSDGGAGA